MVVHSPPPTGSPHPLRVLYVEDNRHDADLTRRALKAHGEHVALSVEPTLADARRALGRSRWDLLLLDMHLPDGSGLELLSELMQDHPDTAVIVLTGSGDEQSAVAALRAGADDYVVKHNDYLQRLPALVQAVMEQHRKRLNRREQPLRVLYAESNDVDIDLLRRHIQRHAPQLRLETVHSAEQVLLRLDRCTDAQALPDVDVLLLDFQLPGMNALELTKELRQTRRVDLPIVILTGQGDEEAAIQTLKLGATDYLVKHSSGWQRLPVALESAHLRVQLERERRALRESEQRFREMAEALTDVFWLTDPARQRVLYVSPAYERVWGGDAAALYRDWSVWLKWVHPEDLSVVREHFSEVPSTRDYDLSFRVLRRDGQLRHVRMRAYAVLDEQGQAVRRVGIAHDITQQKVQEDRIQHLAYHDTLTGLPNRMLVLDRLNQGLAHAQRSRSDLAVIFLDLDRFKTINDTLGHLAGDTLLRQTALRLRAALREQDTVARLGGDEFLVVLEDTGDPASVALVADKLLGTLSRPFELAGQEIHVTASLGLSVYPRDATDAGSLLKYADTALYKAKAAGRNTYRFFSPGMDAQAHAQLRLENDLRRALDRQELLLHYQPQINAQGRLTGFEALVRWMHPQRGLVPPGDFIGLAEDTGLILPIGEWVLRQACLQARIWALHCAARGRPPLRMAVNLSARQLQRPGLEAVVRQALLDSGLDAGLLELEITESSVMDDPLYTLDVLKGLRQLGVQLSVDDFGTGYSSLAYLKRFPLQRLKIDRSFVDGIPHDEDDVAIVEAIIALARKLKLQVVAEGVETEQQSAVLQRLGCDELQGYAFGRPQASGLIDRLLDTTWRDGLVSAPGLQTPAGPATAGLSLH
ncbi:PAS domain S-box-containing protein/diguanylate cyclase (GGDEF)-like protein [Sphaerotilus hippei]|uniref:PAS domain S-box-containing protein/diguanylate cyclase (GGDEF)-like protein n=1 Tax=Sphaerotilus hippei TaxID=744406 RepID=A0A318H569_9BURK|nr:EAL domain-containing protein [Sphaerotilus hippei]PXW98836.1 PAS domain S-box-containing protein/diguanylate cyclase (GGDEF)-like protein [Sphaerotilus hippei]